MVDHSCHYPFLAVNVSRNQNFLDLKLVEMKRERETMEKAKRQAGDRVEEFRRVSIFIHFF